MLLKISESVVYLFFSGCYLPVGGPEESDAAVRVGADEADDDDRALLSLKATPSVAVCIHTYVRGVEAKHSRRGGLRDGFKA